LLHGTPEKAQVVELKFFGGLSMEEIAEALGVSRRTVHNDWAVCARLALSIAHWRGRLSHEHALGRAGSHLCGGARLARG
jgi:predicted DNA-binding protein (UPF0251 family)